MKVEPGGCTLRHMPTLISMIYVNYPSTANGFKDSRCQTQVLLGTLCSKSPDVHLPRPF